MGNPARVATDTVIATSWGLDVADTVTRRYANAATRDADLTGKTAAQLLGQLCTLTDSGSLLQYAGPVMQWRAPWNLPWGYLVSSESNASVVGNGSVQVVLTNAAHPNVAGRRYRYSCGVTMVSGSVSGTMSVYIDGVNGGAFRLNHPTPEGSVYTGYRILTIATTASSTTSLRYQCASPGQLATNGNPSHWLTVEDAGPASNPTALVAGADGSPRMADRDIARAALRGAVLLDAGEILTRRELGRSELVAAKADEADALGITVAELDALLGPELEAA